ncbi:palmitoyltransferase ZDHHC1-like isoform X3 [Narcine bancroftii]|uniref:palmitoyltransferase ZDHHC1-like isoform X3 n=1 Tax=Narcine bancroftii TaxID=1343680 RepID=UPI003831A3AE
MSVSCGNKNIFQKNGNKTAAVTNLLASKFIINQPSRVNGWNWPPHPCQLLCGIVYLFYIITMFAILIPLLPSWWLPAGYTCTSIAFFWHLVFYVFAASIDPVDENVRNKKYKGSVPVLDCSKHKKVIENRHCSLCDVKVGLKSKHCGQCNKCVAEFDHHCKLLNNCIGGRNYGHFLGAVITAIFLNLSVACISSIVLVAYFVDLKLLRTNPKFATISDAQIWIAFLPAASVYITSVVFLTITVITSGLSLIALVYLIDLLRFHIYILWKRISTYEYITRRREQMQSKVSPIEMEEDELPSKSIQKTAGEGSAEYTGARLHFENTTSIGSTTPDTSQNLQSSDVKPSTSKITNDPVSTIYAVVQQTSGKKSLKESGRDLHWLTDLCSFFLWKKKGKKKRIQSTDTVNISPLVSATKSPSVPPLSETDLATAFQVSTNTISTIPSRAFLPPLTPSNVDHVQAAGPPAEYHSDSAESMNEIPVTQTRLGSAAMGYRTATIIHSTKENTGNSLQSYYQTTAQW